MKTSRTPLTGPQAKRRKGDPDPKPGSDEKGKAPSTSAPKSGTVAKKKLQKKRSLEDSSLSDDVDDVDDFDVPDDAADSPSKKGRKDSAPQTQPKNKGLAADGIIVDTAVDSGGAYDVLESANALRVGVQLAVRDGKVHAVMVAGRPESPFTGTMGDHVTAFGVHVVSLRTGLEGKSVTEAGHELRQMVAQLDGLPGVKYIKTEAGHWRMRREQLTTELKLLASHAAEPTFKAQSKKRTATDDSAPGAAEVASLQRAIALYLEVREGVPLSLLNTRSITADAGWGRGEAKWLQRLAPIRGEGQTKRAKGSGDSERGEIAAGLFDQDAAALLLFNRGQNLKEAVKGLLPSHTDVDKLMKAKPEQLKQEMLVQHMQSVFPNEDLEKKANLLTAVREKLTTALEERSEKDKTHWHNDVKSRCLMLHKAGTSQDLPIKWLTAHSGVSDEFADLYKTLDLITTSAKQPFQLELRRLYTATLASVDKAIQLADGLPSAPKTEKARALDPLKVFLLNCPPLLEALSQRDPKTLTAKSFAGVRAALKDLNKALAGVTPPSVLQDNPLGAADIVMTDLTASVTSPGKAVVKQLGPVAVLKPLPKFEQSKAKPSGATKEDEARAKALLKELTTGYGNSFTVALGVGVDGKTTKVALRGRTPSPFKNTMGAHATAWTVWVHAVSQLVEGVTLDQAGENLVRFTEGIVGNAVRENAVVGDSMQSAQNANRRDNARWTPGSLEAWVNELKSHQEKPWTLQGVQSYAQSVFAFVNMMPGTTRWGKNTDGHGEAGHWAAALAQHQAGNEQAASWGPGLFDAGPNAWVLPRHTALMGLALGGTKSDAWKNWVGVK